MVFGNACEAQLVSTSIEIPKKGLCYTWNTRQNNATKKLLLFDETSTIQKHDYKSKQVTHVPLIMQQMDIFQMLSSRVQSLLLRIKVLTQAL